MSEHPAFHDSQHARLTVIVVNHESWPDAVRLTASLIAEPEFSSGQCRIVVVDNASRGPIPAALLNPPSGLRLVVRSQNEGFAAGVNTGWRLARSGHPEHQGLADSTVPRACAPGPPRCQWSAAR